MVAKTPRVPKPPEFYEPFINQLSEQVYRIRLGDADVASMIAKDKDNGEKLASRAKAMNQLSQAYCKALGISYADQVATQ